MNIHQTRYFIIDNFFGDQLHYLLPYLRERQHYDVDEHPEYGASLEYQKERDDCIKRGVPPTTGTWPGKRSLDIFKDNPAIACLFTNAMGSFMPEGVQFSRDTLYTHFRYDDPNSPDWVHRDGTPITTIVYLSETNLNSGTGFYDAETNGNLILDVPFVQNRAVIFHGDVWHGSKGNYGTTKDDARFTMNFFFHPNDLL